ncbi:MAG: VPLPA-CTERM sorting domain-containing protein [Gammaproteobacteria bacterium]|nr:VPLPA-CTERM sorting domain-containing protein [Gammaproteobacteria bacterium]
MITKNLVAVSGVAALSLLTMSSASAVSLSVFTSAGTVSDSQGPVTTGALNSLTTDSEGSDFSWAGPAQAQAAADDTGRSAVSAEGLYACGSCEFDLVAESLFATSYTNNTSGSVNFTYDFYINGPTVEVVDYANVGPASGLSAEAYVDVWMSTSGGASDTMGVSAQLFGGDAGHDFYSYGSTASYFENGGIFGYTLNDVSGSFSGVLAAGETAYIDTEMYAAIFGPGWEVGARASIGDPNDLSAGPGFSGDFTVSAVPVPAAVWLFGSGLIGLIGIARRKA